MGLAGIRVRLCIYTSSFFFISARIERNLNYRESFSVWNEEHNSHYLSCEIRLNNRAYENAYFYIWYQFEGAY